MQNKQQPATPPLEARKMERAILDLARQGRMKDAVQHCQDLNRRFPAFASGWYTTSQLAAKTGNATVGLGAIDQALKLEPKENRWHLQRAFCLMQLGELATARDIALQLDGFDWSSGYQWASVGLLLSRLGLQESALHHYQQAIRREPDRGEHYYNAATMHRFLGNLDGAEQCLEQAIARSPEDFEAYKLRSDLRTQSAEHNNIPSLKQALEQHVKNPKAAVQLNYSLAKEFEDIGEWSDAFSHLRQGAKARRKHMRYDVQGDLDTMAKIAEIYPHIGPEDTAAGCKNDEAIFIIGMPRTGTTLVERILGSHSQVFAAGELNTFALEMMKAIRINTAAGGSRPASKQEAVGCSADLNFRQLGENYIDSTRPDTTELPRFVDKMPVNFLYAGLIHRALPGAKIIHLRRHPLDTCYAIYKNLFADAYPFSYSLEELGRYYAAYDRLMAHWHRAMPGVIRDVHYEEVVADLEAQTGALLEYCDLDFEPQCLRFHENRAASTTASAVQVRQPLYSSSVGKWRNFQRELAPLIAVLCEEGIDPEVD